mgnify:CR=1|tara:strand:+ start:63 stop:359 length:297 start_codon:yes stop_codon:yes gene_type:complete
MAIYTNISSIATTTLITKGAGISGSISRISISNHDNADLVIAKLYLYDGSNTYVITEVTIPALTTLVLDESDNISFDSKVYDLKIDTSTTADITIIIK